MRVLILRWGAAKRFASAFARVDTLIEHYRSEIKWRKENQRFKHNLTLSVKATPPDEVKLTAGEVQLLMEAGMLKKIERQEAA